MKQMINSTASLLDAQKSYIKNYTDQLGTRYHLAKSIPDDRAYNWVFIPGGPGVDSAYFLNLVERLDMPGNYWLIDFPANGDNMSASIPAEYEFDKWQACFMETIGEFESPIVVGHSFGGEFPLLFPELEDKLKGLVILNASPSLWFEEAEKCARENDLPMLDQHVKAFSQNPCQQTFNKLIMACTPYYFPATSIERGRKLFASLPMNYHATLWWLKEAQESNYDAKWVPQNVKTMIIGASITPFTLFENDRRFQRQNISLKKVDSAGHFPWIEQPNTVQKLFSEFYEQMTD